MQENEINPQKLIGHSKQKKTLQIGFIFLYLYVVKLYFYKKKNYSENRACFTRIRRENIDRDGSIIISSSKRKCQLRLKYIYSYKEEIKKMEEN